MPNCPTKRLLQLKKKNAWPRFGSLSGCEWLLLSWLEWVMCVGGLASSKRPSGLCWSDFIPKMVMRSWEEWQPHTLMSIVWVGATKLTPKYPWVCSYTVTSSLTLEDFLHKSNMYSHWYQSAQFVLLKGTDTSLTEAARQGKCPGLGREDLSWIRTQSPAGHTILGRSWN